MIENSSGFFCRAIHWDGPTGYWVGTGDGKHWDAWINDTKRIHFLIRATTERKAEEMVRGFLNLEDCRYE